MMKNPEYVIYIPGVGDVPAERNNIPARWQSLGLETELHHINWSAVDYKQRIEAIGARIVELSKQGRVSAVGDSGGGKPVLSLFARHTEHLHRIATISSKVEPYVLAPKTAAALPNLVLSSDTLPMDLEKIRSESVRSRILCVHPISDAVVAPEDAVLEGAEEYTVDAHDHITGIRLALTADADVIARFLQQD